MVTGPVWDMGLMVLLLSAHMVCATSCQDKVTDVKTPRKAISHRPEVVIFPGTNSLAQYSTSAGEESRVGRRCGLSHHSLWPCVERRLLFLWCIVSFFLLIINSGSRGPRLPFSQSLGEGDTSPVGQKGQPCGPTGQNQRGLFSDLKM